MSGIREHIRLVEGVPSQHFASMLKSRVAAAFAEELATASAATDKMVAGWKDHSARGVSFPTGSFDVTLHGEALHLNIPTAIATPAAIDRIHEIIAQAEVATRTKLAIKREVKGGSNYIIDGTISDADPGHHYEDQAAAMPLVNRVKHPMEGDRARTATGAIVVWRDGQWAYA